MIRPLLFTCSALLSLSVEAHLLKVFATTTGDQLNGKVYFSGGTAVADASVSVTKDGQQPITLRTDQQGSFSTQLTSPGHYQISADSGEGHMAHWQVFHAQAPVASADQATSVKAIMTPSIDQQLVREVVRQELAAQIAPLQQQLLAAEDELRYRDILGALGFIVGLGGLAYGYSARKQQA